MTPRQLQAAFLAACEQELAAPKPGNVHLHAAGHGMTAEDFRLSARQAAGPLCACGSRLGARIFGAITATRAAVGQNTNLGIVLLCAPLAIAAELGGPLRAGVTDCIDRADLTDADLVFRAIALASPGGLGTAEEHDVRAPARVPLAAAMRAASHRDRIAYQWAHGYADVFDLGLSTLREARATAAATTWSTTVVTYLALLATFPDSHIARKYGDATAEAVRLEAAAFRARVAHAHDLAPLLPELLAWDAKLKGRGLNPGTTADLTVATIFADRLAATLQEGGVDG